MSLGIFFLTFPPLLAHDIDVGGAKLIKQHAYGVNPEKRALMQKEIECMVENVIAEPNNSPWSSPCILVPKAITTSPRFCSDFRKLHSVTTPDDPLLRVDNCGDRSGSARYVSKFDFLKGYKSKNNRQRNVY